jgi:F-type H+-transporting ATPase subunit b
MGKIGFYALLVTLCLWFGGIVPLVHAQDGLAEQVDIELPEAMQPRHGADPAAPAYDDPGMPFLLDVNIGSAVWNLIVFLLLFGILAKFVWPPILRGLQQRDAKIRGDLDQAERANREAQATLAQYKTQLAEAQREAQKIIDESKTAAQRVSQQIKQQAETELAQMRTRAQADIAAAREQAIAEVYEQTAALATQVAAQVLKREVRPEDHEQLIQQSLKGLETAGAA